MRFGAIETGGTKIVCAIGDEFGNIEKEVSIPTTTPDETLNKVFKFFDDESKIAKIDAYGIAAFGPLNLNKNSTQYGNIMETPKEGWANFPLLAKTKEHFQTELVFIDTDVNGSCLGEMTFGTAKGLSSVCYITIGTGIGAGIAVDGKLVHGMLHPEFGHILMTPKKGDESNCICPFHAGCFEGLASGPSIEKRWGKCAKDLYDDEKVWDLEAEYISTACVSLIMTVSPERIILGGGVMHQDKLFELIRIKVKEKIAGYIQTDLLCDMDHYIVEASLNDKQGILGCIELANIGYQENKASFLEL